MISSVKAQVFGPPAASRVKPGALEFSEFGERRVEEVADINPSGGQDEHESHGSFGYNDLSQMAANLVIEAELDAAHQKLAAEAVSEISEDLAETLESPDFEDHPGNGGESNVEGFVGDRDRRAAPTTPPQGSSADDTTVVANGFAPAQGLDAVTGREDLRRAAKVYESVTAKLASGGIRPGDVLDSYL